MPSDCSYEAEQIRKVCGCVFASVSNTEKRWWKVGVKMQDMEQSSVLSLAEESDKPRARKSCGEELLSAWAQGEEGSERVLPIIREPHGGAHVTIRAKSIRRKRPQDLRASGLLEMSRVDSHKRLLEAIGSPDIQDPLRTKAAPIRFFKCNGLSEPDHLPPPRHHLLDPTLLRKQEGLRIGESRSLTQSPVSPFPMRPDRR